jgi:hypothetical protein
MTYGTPYVTIVVTSRNDTHGGNLLQRMQLFVNGLLEQCQRHQLNAELVLVEWNPPPNKPRLTQALSWPVDKGPCSVRIIEVPSEIHQRFKYADRLPLFQMIAKNVGIRRARGQFILATNIDILFSDELVQFLASGHLKQGYVYRIDRYDVPADMPADAAIQGQLEYCRRNVMRISSRNGTCNLKQGDFHRIYSPIRYLPDPLDRILNLLLPVKMKEWWLYKEHRRLRTGRARLHTNACGDFTLMDREHWVTLLGYPEFEMFSFHLDSLLCYAAHHGGIREKVLKDPMRIYHIEHTAGWTPEIERDKSLKRRLDSSGIPQVSNKQLDDWAVQMRRENRPIIFNDETWGLANEDLMETTLDGEMKTR